MVSPFFVTNINIYSVTLYNNKPVHIDLLIKNTIEHVILS